MKLLLLALLLGGCTTTSSYTFCQAIEISKEDGYRFSRRYPEPRFADFNECESYRIDIEWEEAVCECYYYH